MLHVYTCYTILRTYIFLSLTTHVYVCVMCVKNPVTGVNSVTTLRIKRLGVTCCVTCVNISNKKTAALVEQRLAVRPPLGQK